MFDLQSRILSSADPVTIRRTDLEVTGSNMTFDTQTRQGKFTGPTRMLIYKADDEASPSQEASAP
jgi:lipopolysaccharide export system protein LptC